MVFGAYRHMEDHLESESSQPSQSVLVEGLQQHPTNERKFTKKEGGVQGFLLVFPERNGNRKTHTLGLSVGKGRLGGM